MIKIEMYNKNEVPNNPSKKWINKHVKIVYLTPTYKLLQTDTEKTLDICLCGCCLDNTQSKCTYCESVIEWQ